MKKKIIISFTILSVFLGGFIFFTNNQYILFWKLNAINVTVEKPLIKEKIKIEYGINANYYNRFVIGNIPHREKYSVLLFNGEVKNDIPNKYGENDFLITYDNKYYLTFRHFKTNWKRHHKYEFRFYLKDNNIFIQAEIKGFYNETFNKPMIELQTK